MDHIHVLYIVSIIIFSQCALNVCAHPLRASDRYLQEKRKIITGDDILFAMATLRFYNHIDPLRIFLQKY